MSYDLYEAGQYYDIRLRNQANTAIIIGHEFTDSNLIQLVKNNGQYWKKNQLVPEWIFDGFGDGKAGTIRPRFQQILARIKLLSPTIKRVLVHAESKWLKYLFPDLENHTITDLHGSIFTVDGIELVITFPLTNRSIKFQKYMDRDLVRYFKLTKWQDLDYTTDPLPFTITGRVVMDFETSDISCLKFGQLPEAVTLGVQYLDDNGTKKRHLLVGKEQIDNALAILIANQDSITDLVGHNIQFDLNLTSQLFRRSFYGKVRDTVLRSRASGEPDNGLKFLSNYYTKRPGHYVHTILSRGRLGSYMSTAQELVKGNGYTVAAYICEDLETTWLLFDKWHTALPVVEVMEKAIVIASCQTHWGTFIDRAKLEVLAPEVDKTITELKANIVNEYGAEFGTVELDHELSKRKVRLTRLANGRLSYNTADLRELGLNDMADLVQYQKLQNSFVKTFVTFLRPDDTMIHHQGIMAAETGRSTMSNYNHQQSPRKGPIRGLYCSRWKGGKFFSLDFAQAELRVAAWISNCKAMALWLMSSDAHRYIASKAFGVALEAVTDDQRQDAKAVAFRTIYGGWPQNEGQKRVRQYMQQAFPELFAWMELTQLLAKTEQMVTDPWGKTRNLRGCWDLVFPANVPVEKWNYKRENKAGREAINSPIQGWASHLAIWVMVRLQELFWEHELNSVVLFGVHDSINSDVHPAEIDIATKLYRQAMAELPIGDVPMAAICPLIGELQIADTWADTKKAEKIKMSSGSAPGISNWQWN